MKRHIGLIGGIVVVLMVLGASLTTVQAYQASAADRARMQYSTAHHQTVSLISQAQTDGLTPTELAPLRRHQAAIASRSEPTGIAFFHPGLESFYNRQSRALLKLDRAVHAAIRTASLQRRADASAALHSLRASITTAQTLDTSAGAASHTLAAQQAAYNQAHLPKDYAAVAAQAGHASTLLAASYRDEQRYVAAEVKQTHGSVAAIQQQGSAEISRANAQLPLLGLLTSRANTYQSELASRQSDLSKQQSAFGAAVKEWDIRSLAAKVSADYARTVPAKMIVVSTETQTARVYQDGQVVLTTPVTTGGPELPTDHGVFHIYFKTSPFVFHSPFPVGSPYYYLPSPVQYWMPFDGQEGLHDASWRSNFGPGSNYQPTDLGTGHYILGTHGCVNLPLAAAAFIWNFAPVGTTVVVI